MKKILITALVLAGFSATAQVKVGSNPTTLATDAKFQVEGSTGAQTVILDNGKVGIGTTTPSQKLHIQGIGTGGNSATDAAAMFLQNSATDAVTTLRLGAGTTGYGYFGTYGENYLYGNAAYDNISIYKKNTMLLTTSVLTDELNIAAPKSTGVINFYTGDDKDVNKRMTIASDGNIGIGTTTPTYKLDVVSGANAFEFMNGSGSNERLQGTVGSTGFKFNALNSSGVAIPITFSGAGTERFRIDNSGFIGIANNAPSYMLDVTNSTENTFRFLNGTGAYERVQATLGSSGFNMAVMNTTGNGIPFIFTGGTTERMRIHSDGNVGIGTATPTEKLEVNGNIKLTSTFNLGMLSNSGLGIARFGANMPNLLTTGDLASQGGFISFDPRAGQNAISLWVREPNLTTENQALVISNKGNVGIGTTTPKSKLQVVGLPVYADNAAAIAGGLTAGAFYHAGDGIVRVVF